jgi:hypothetical protein
MALPSQIFRYMLGEECSESCHQRWESQAVQKHESHQSSTVHGGWLARSLTSTLSGVMFAAVLTSLLVALQAAGVRPLRMVEQAGIDVGMWLYANVGWFAADEPAATSKVLKYAFVDVDRAACAVFLDGESPATCETENPVRSALVVDLVRSLRAAGAAVVLIDVTPPPANAPRERDAWRSALVADSGPWIIAPLYARPSDDCSDGLSIRGDRRYDIVPSHAAGRLRLVSVATRLDPELADGVVRHYPLASRLQLEGEAPRWVPTAPMLAAVLARGGSIAEIDRLWYQPAAVSTGHACNTGAAEQPLTKPLPSDNLFDARANAGTPAVVRFFFSLPGLSTMDEAQRHRVEQRHLSVYERYAASKLIEGGCTHRLDAQATPRPGCFAVRAPLFEGKVVIIGSSSATALDRSQTPAGPMSGAEIIVNATRAFAEFPALHTPDGWTMWLSKMANLWKPALIALLTWMGIHKLCDLVRSKEDAAGQLGHVTRQRLLAYGRQALAVQLFLLGMAVSAWVEMHELVHELAQVHSSAEPVEMLLPLVSMGLEGYAEFAVLITAVFHHQAQSVVGWLASRLKANRHTGKVTPPPAEPAQSRSRRPPTRRKRPSTKERKS